MNFRKITAIILCFVIIFAFAGCTQKEVNLLGIKEKVAKPDPNAVTLDLFAPEESMPAVISIVEKYKSAAPNVSVRVSLDDGIMVAEKVLSGYSCDLLIDYTEIMDQIDGLKGADVNPNGYNCIYSQTRMDVFTGPADEELYEEGTATYSIALPLSCKYSDEAKALAEFFKNECCADVCAEYGFSIIQ